MAQGMGAFAQGLANGFMMGRQIRKDREEREFKDALKAASKDVSVSEQFSVVDPEGNTQVFDKQEDALKAMEGKEGFRLDHTFMVGDQAFADAEQAQYAARQANSPAMKLARQAEVAMQYGQPQLAVQYAQAHDKIIDTNRNLAWNQVDAYEKEGNVEGLLQMISRQDGSSSYRLEQDEQGQLVMVREKDGKPHPFFGPFKDPADMFSTIKHGLSVNYQNALALYQHDQSHGLNVRRQQETERHNRVSESHSAANIGLRGAELGFRQQQFDWERNNYNNPRPDVQFGYDAQGQKVPITTQLGRTPDGGWSTTVTPGQPLPGVLGRTPQGMSEYDRMLQGLGGNTSPGSLTDGLTPEQLRSLGQMLSANRRPPAAANTGGATPAAPTAPRNGGLQVVPAEVENQVNPYGNLPYGR